MDEAARLFQIRRTVLQMLVDRGYIVAQNEIDMDKEAFKEVFTETPSRAQLVATPPSLLCSKGSDPFLWTDAAATEEGRSHRSVTRLLARRTKSGSEAHQEIL